MELSRKMDKGIYYTLDIKQAVRSKHTPMDYMEIFKDRLSTVHINDVSLDASCLLPGQGELNLKEIVEGVRKINSDIPYIIEVYRENFNLYEQLREAKEYLLGM
jgi:sugar phosphate isomerase/epimerase